VANSGSRRASGDGGVGLSGDARDYVRRRSQPGPYRRARSATAGSTPSERRFCAGAVPTPATGPTAMTETGSATRTSGKRSRWKSIRGYLQLTITDIATGIPLVGLISDATTLFEPDGSAHCSSVSTDCGPTSRSREWSATSSTTSPRPASCASSSSAWSPCSSVGRATARTEASPSGRVSSNDRQDRRLGSRLLPGARPPDADGSLHLAEAKRPCVWPDLGREQAPLSVTVHRGRALRPREPERQLQTGERPPPLATERSRAAPPQSPFRTTTRTRTSVRALRRTELRIGVGELEPPVRLPDREQGRRSLPRLRLGHARDDDLARLRKQGPAPDPRAPREPRRGQRATRTAAPVVNNLMRLWLVRPSPTCSPGRSTHGHPGSTRRSR